MNLCEHPLFAEIDFEKNKEEFPEINYKKITTGSNKKLYWKCPNCGNIYLSSISHRCLDFTSCPKCNYKKIIYGFNDLETFCKKNNRTDILEDFDLERNFPKLPKNIYVKSLGKFWFKCPECGNLYEEYLYNKIKHNSSCRLCNTSTYCRNIDRRLSFEEVRKRIEEDTGGEYTLLSKPESYRNQKSKLLVRHNCEKCKNHEYLVSFGNFSLGKRCPACFSKHPKRDTRYAKKFLENSGYFSYVSGNLENSKSKITVKCNFCGKNQDIQWNHLQQGQKCKYCNESGFNKDADKYLQEFGLTINKNYFRETKFEDCKDKLCLPFDFQIFSKNRDYYILIELQGKQHYLENSKYYNEILLRHDKIKKIFCDKNNICLYQIFLNKRDKKSIEYLKTKIADILMNLGY